MMYDDAVRFAYRAHSGQTRKYTGDPYITHPVAVAKRIRDNYFDFLQRTPFREQGASYDRILSAAILHDVVEDCGITLDEIGEMFGDLVKRMVSDLTKRDYPGKNRAERKRLEIERYRGTLIESKFIKIADIDHNLGSIVEHDPSFAKVFIQESRDLVGTFDDLKDLFLYKSLLGRIERAESEIGRGHRRKLRGLQPSLIVIDEYSNS